MAKRLTAKEAVGRFEVFCEAAEHLSLIDYPLGEDYDPERMAKPYVVEFLERQASKWFDIARGIAERGQTNG